LEHELKCWPTPFAATLDGSKPFEIRKYDRPFRVGDTLVLREWAPRSQAYTGRQVRRFVSYVARGEFGLPDDLCVLGCPRDAGGGS